MPDDRLMALCELSQDLFFHKIPAGRLPYYIEASLEAGQTAAQNFCGRRTILDLYHEYGIGVAYKDKSGTSFGVTLRGQAIMGAKECKVELYTDSIQALAEHSGYDETPGLDYDQALCVHLAHEFFHFWEYKTGDSITERLEGVETMKLFGYSRKAKINRCGEVAAHAFAKALLGLPFLPNLYDYLYLIGAGKMTRQDFALKLDAYANMLPHL